MQLRCSENPLAITQVWKMSFELTSRYVSPLYFFLLIFTILQTLPVIIWGKWTVEYGMPFLGQQTELAWYWAASQAIFTVLIVIFISLTAVHQLGTSLEGNSAKLKDSINVAIKKLPLMFFTALLAYIFIAIGFFLVLPGIYLFLMVFLITPIVVFENTGLFKAIKRSLSLLWGNWWRTLSIILLTILVTAAFMLFIGGCGALLLLLHIPDSIAPILQVALQLLLLPLISLFFYAVTVLLWHDLKLRKNLSQTNYGQKTVANSSGE